MSATKNTDEEEKWWVGFREKKRLIKKNGEYVLRMKESEYDLSRRKKKTDIKKDGEYALKKEKKEFL